ncbi:hypothetical protein SB778_00305 [Paraburkholderia sp. SIMBA_050]|uniref:hypothetical protein n=1 Tax=Paraburkholderia terricola TaxID=169427 RepID=UPI0018780CA0
MTRERDELSIIGKAAPDDVAKGKKRALLTAREGVLQDPPVDNPATDKVIHRFTE